MSSTVRRPRAGTAVLVPAVLATLLLGACGGGSRTADLTAGPSDRGTPAAASPARDATSPASAPSSSDPAGGAATDAARTAAGRPLRITLTEVTRSVSPDGVRATYPKVSATGGPDGAADRAQAAVTAAVTARVDEFTAAAAELSDRPAEERFVTVDGHLTAWGHYLSVDLDTSAQLAGAHPTNTTDVVVLDRRTGRPLHAADLFTSTAAVDRLVRAGLLTTGDPVGTLKPSDVAGLSVVPDASGSTAPMSCWPATAGLTCSVDQGSVLGYAAGPLTAVVPWSDLDDVLRDGVR